MINGNDIYMWAEQQVRLNPFLGAMILGAGVYVLRNIPKQLLYLVRSQFIVTLTLTSDQQFFHSINSYISKQNYSRRSRNIAFIDNYDTLNDKWSWSFTFGNGRHIIWFNSVPIVLVREEAQKNQGDGRVMSYMRLYSLGRSQKIISKFVEDVDSGDKRSSIQKIYVWSSNQFSVANIRIPRMLSTIFLNDDIIEEMKTDIDRFLNAHQEYNRRGDPYRRTYALEGPPGTGKTSLVQALAAHIGRDVYVIDLSAIGNDDSLRNALNGVGQNGVALIEDIDAKIFLSKRNDDFAPTSMLNSNNFGGLTLSGILNALGGVAARDGRILFITTNYIKNLDSALLRAGRVDKIQHIGPIREAQARLMAAHYFPFDNSLTTWFDDNIANNTPIIANELRKLLINTRDSQLA